MWLLLEAEAATFVNKHRKEVQRLFDKAISAALHCGFTNYAAIANERAAEHMLMDPSEKFWGQTYFKDARDCYLHWGAEAKAAQIEDRYKSLLEGSCRETSSAKNIRGRERYTILPMRGLSDLQWEDLSKLDKGRKRKDPLREPSRGFLDYRLCDHLLVESYLGCVVSLNEPEVPPYVEPLVNIEAVPLQVCLQHFVRRDSRLGRRRMLGGCAMMRPILSSKKSMLHVRREG